MTSLPRTRKGTDERRAELLELGLTLFASKPYDEVSIDEIAGAAGVSKGLLYHYFGGKRAFYVAVVREAAERLDQAIAPRLDLPPKERALVGLGAYLDFVEERGEAFTALMRGGLGTDGEIAAIIDRTRNRIVGRFLDGLGLDEPRPIFRTAAASWIGAVESASLDWLAHRDIDRDALVLLMLSSLAAQLAAARRLDPDAGVALHAMDDLLGLLR